MTLPELIRHRLINQQIAATTVRKPVEIVKWLVAMQAQEYAHAKWAIGLRLPGIKEMDVEKAFNAGGILRTHLMRPTWHFITPTDIRWMLKLTVPRVHAVNAYMYRKLELDAKTLRRSNNLLIKALKGGKHLTRPALQSVLLKSKIKAGGHRLSYLMMFAELECIICSGPRQGKQFTYALFDERVPLVKSPDRNEALIELVRRYFTTRGPATIRDFTWWSGLTVKDTMEGLAAIKNKMHRDTIDGEEYWFFPRSGAEKNKELLQSSFLMPDYDEYGISYKNRSALFNPKYGVRGSVYSHWVVVNGQIAGTWNEVNKDKTLRVETSLSPALTKSQQRGVAASVKRFVEFRNRPN